MKWETSLLIRVCILLCCIWQSWDTDVFLRPSEVRLLKQQGMLASSACLCQPVFTSCFELWVCSVSHSKLTFVMMSKTALPQSICHGLIKLKGRILIVFISIGNRWKYYNLIFFRLVMLWSKSVYKRYSSRVCSLCVLAGRTESPLQTSAWENTWWARTTCWKTREEVRLTSALMY